MAISDIVGKSVLDFVDYSMIVVVIMLIWYIFKFFFIAPPPTKENREAELEEGRAQWKKWFTTAKEKRDAQNEQIEKDTKRKKREFRIKHPKAELVSAIGECEKLIRAILKRPRNADGRENLLHDAKRSLRRLEEHLTNAVHDLNYIRRKESGEEHAFFDQLFAYCGTALTIAEKLELPEVGDSADDWTTKINEAEAHLRGDQGVRGICGATIEKLDKFSKEAATEKITDAAITQSEGRARGRTPGTP